ncbi:MAG TPA: HAD family hydrolase [Candidatus Saccharimonadales bacterium]|nr:HAD family hydrolase [Candidatus Saccharimonadales bacterium]
MDSPTLALLDIDGTLLDPSYGSNDTSLKEFIGMQRQAGLTCGLNSNRALHDLLPIAVQFGIQGPIVGENGLFVYYPETKRTVFLMEQPELEALKRVKHDMERCLQDTLASFFPEKQVVWQDVDTVQAVQQPASDYPEGTIVVLNNKYRSWTISAHVKVCQDGRLVAFPEALPRVVQTLQESEVAKNVTVASSPDFANVLVYSTSSSKRAAVEYLLEHDYSQHRLLVIGDEQSDVNMAKGIGEFMTTANSPDAIKAQASAVASEPYAKGVHELLKRSLSTA